MSPLIKEYTIKLPFKLKSNLSGKTFFNIARKSIIKKTKRNKENLSLSIDNILYGKN